MPNIGFGLAFDVERTAGTISGWRPARTKVNSQLRLFAKARLLGFVAALESGWAEKMVIVGGNEGRYMLEHPPPNQAKAIEEMLVMDHSIPRSQVRSMRSLSNTIGNVAMIRKIVQDEKLSASDCAVLTSMYHVLRVKMDLQDAGLGDMPVFPAEALWLYQARYDLERARRKTQLARMLTGGTRWWDVLAFFVASPFAKRTADEINGICQKIEKTYRPRTNVP